MSRARALAIAITALLVAAVVRWGVLDSPPLHPPTPPPQPIEHHDEPEQPVEDSLRDPSAPPEGPAAFAERLLDALRAAHRARSTDGAEEALLAMVDAQGFGRDALGAVWGALSDVQRASALGDLITIATMQAIRGSEGWLRQVPRIRTVSGDDRTARVATGTGDVASVVFVLRRTARGWVLLDVEIEEVSATRSYRTQIEARFDRSNRDVGPVLEHLGDRAERVRTGRDRSP